MTVPVVEEVVEEVPVVDVCDVVLNSLSGAQMRVHHVTACGLRGSINGISISHSPSAQLHSAIQGALAWHWLEFSWGFRLAGPS